MRERANSKRHLAFMNLINWFSGDNVCHCTADRIPQTRSLPNKSVSYPNCHMADVPKRYKS